MALSCSCDDWFDYYADPDEDFSIAKQNCKCESCGKKIKSGETALKFHCWRPADPDSGDPVDIQADENGDDVHLQDEFHCERCGDIYMNLHTVGYCLCSGDHMPSLLKEYQEMTGFDPEKYKAKKMKQRIIKLCIPLCGIIASIIILYLTLLNDFNPFLLVIYMLLIDTIIPCSLCLFIEIIDIVKYAKNNK